jgi:ABC-type dipeptide/oligopeptide/nickel transport system ATPase component
VEDILRKLNFNRSFLSDYQGMIGIDKHIEQIQSLLHLDSEDVRIVGIWGMGGIGKTTIASAIYHKLATQFCSNSIILNVQQEIERFGLHYIQRKYVPKLRGENNTSSRLRFSYDPRFKWTKSLLVLDDINNSDQLTNLIGMRINFEPGSRIIVTSRDMQVLKNVDADEIYEVKGMNFRESLQLFCLNAFKQNYPVEDYAGLTEKILYYAKGVPLALKVLGFLLCSRTKEAWESQLKKMDKLPEKDIFKVLKLSYKCLDEEQKDIFLDIACFYIGHLESIVVQTLNSRGFSKTEALYLFQKVEL